MCYIPDSRNNWTQTIKHEDIGVLGNLIWCVLAEKNGILVTTKLKLILISWLLMKTDVAEYSQCTFFAA